MVKDYANNQNKLIAVPRIPNFIICPVVAIKNLLDITPRGSNLPLFQLKLAQEWIPVTDNRVRRHFSLILAKLNLSKAVFTFHKFRSSGAAFAFNNDVTLQNIQKHGTWTLDCVWRYITDTVNAREQVANMFRNKLSSKSTKTFGGP